MSVIKVKNVKFRDALMNHEDGETVYCEEEKQCFVWQNGAYQPVNSTVDAAGEIKVNYRDLVISALSTMEPFTEEQVKKYQVLLNAWDEIQNKEFYMLYARELDYFTLFHRIPNEGNRCIGKEIFDCLFDLGFVIYVEDFTEDDYNIIFWVKTPEGKLTEVYLFDYTRGVVPFA